MKGITHLGAFVERARRDGDLLEIDRPADPFLEIAAVARATDGGPAVLFRNVQGYPGRTVLTNVFGCRRRIARMFDVHPDYLPRRLADAALSPIASVQVREAPCQSHVVTTDIDIAINVIDKALERVNEQRATFGAVQNRFNAVIESLQINMENTSTSRGRIMDADFAAETANLARVQILTQAGTAMLAQANQTPEQVLALLRS